MTQSYITITIPWVSREFQTPWHPTTDVGPFATLQRGNFATMAEAIQWAREHMNGTPYALRRIDG